MCKESPKGSGYDQGFQLVWVWGWVLGIKCLIGHILCPYRVGFVYIQTLLAEQSSSPLRPSVMAQKRNHISFGEICTDLNFLFFILWSFIHVYSVWSSSYMYTVCGHHHICPLLPCSFSFSQDSPSHIPSNLMSCLPPMNIGLPNFKKLRIAFSWAQCLLKLQAVNDQT